MAQPNATSTRGRARGRSRGRSKGATAVRNPEIKFAEVKRYLKSTDFGRRRDLSQISESTRIDQVSTDDLCRLFAFLCSFDIDPMSVSLSRFVSRVKEYIRSSPSPSSESITTSTTTTATTIDLSGFTSANFVNASKRNLLLPYLTNLCDRHQQQKRHHHHASILASNTRSIGNLNTTNTTTTLSVSSSTPAKTLLVSSCSSPKPSNTATKRRRRQSMIVTPSQRTPAKNKNTSGKIRRVIVNRRSKDDSNLMTSSTEVNQHVTDDVLSSSSYITGTVNITKTPHRRSDDTCQRVQTDEDHSGDDTKEEEEAGLSEEGTMAVEVATMTSPSLSISQSSSVDIFSHSKLDHHNNMYSYHPITNNHHSSNCNRDLMALYKPCLVIDTAVCKAHIQCDRRMTKDASRWKSLYHRKQEEVDELYMTVTQLQQKVAALSTHNNNNTRTTAVPNGMRRQRCQSMKGSRSRSSVKKRRRSEMYEEDEPSQLTPSMGTSQRNNFEDLIDTEIEGNSALMNQSNKSGNRRRRSLVGASTTCGGVSPLKDRSITTNVPPPVLPINTTDSLSPPAPSSRDGTVDRSGTDGIGGLTVAAKINPVIDIDKMVAQCIEVGAGSKSLSQLKVKELQCYLRKYDLQLWGLKSVLIERVRQHFIRHSTV